jgi:hypothetical protein
VVTELTAKGIGVIDRRSIVLGFRISYSVYVSFLSRLTFFAGYDETTTKIPDNNEYVAVGVSGDLCLQ